MHNDFTDLEIFYITENHKIFCYIDSVLELYDLIIKEHRSFKEFLNKKYVNHIFTPELEVCLFYDIKSFNIQIAIFYDLPFEYNIINENIKFKNMQYYNDKIYMLEFIKMPSKKQFYKDLKEYE